MKTEEKKLSRNREKVRYKENAKDRYISNHKNMEEFNSPIVPHLSLFNPEKFLKYYDRKEAKNREIRQSNTYVKWDNLQVKKALFEIK